MRGSVSHYLEQALSRPDFVLSRVKCVFFREARSQCSAQDSVAVRPDIRNPFATVRVSRQFDPDLRARWRAFESVALFSPYQCLEWYECWLGTAGRARHEVPLVVEAFDAEGTLTLILPLVAARRGPVVIAKFPGDKHTNANFPLIHPNVVVGEEVIGALLARLAESAPGIDLYWFDALPAQWSGRPNPLLRASRSPHSATGSVIDLRLDHVNSRLSRQRSSHRKLIKLGARIRRVEGQAEVNTAMAAFFDQKSAWFRDRRLPDAFGRLGVTAFLAKLFNRTEGVAELYALDLEGTPVAVAGLLVTAGRACLMFISYDGRHPWARLGLGTHLVRSLIQLMGHRGIAQFDFGLGDAEYKRLLGADTERFFVLAQPITVKGRVAAIALLTASRMKALLKASPKLLTVAQHARWLASRRQRSQPASDG